jgi:hypothetical protein
LRAKTRRRMRRRYSGRNRGATTSHTCNGSAVLQGRAGSANCNCSAASVVHRGRLLVTEWRSHDLAAA